MGSGSSQPMGTDQSSQGSSATGSSAGEDSGAAGHASDKHVSGKVTKVSKDEVTITPKKGSPMTLQMNDQTSVKIDGKDAKPSQLKAGQWAKASFQEEGSQEVAVTIEAGHMKQGHHAKSGSSGHMGGSTGSGSDTGSSGSSGSGSSGTSQ
jgi:hypothetical protein